MDGGDSDWKPACVDSLGTASHSAVSPDGGRVGSQVENDGIAGPALGYTSQDLNQHVQMSTLAGYGDADLG